MRPEKMKSGSSFWGTTAMTAASALRVAIQVLVLPVIGRLLGPHAYGQIALVSPFIIFSMVLAESGLGACIVRADETSPSLEGTIFCFSSIFSIAIILLFAVLAYPLGYLLNEPSFPFLLLAMSSTLLLASFNIVPAALLLRAKKYKWIALSDVASSIGGVIGVTIGIMLDWGVWSLVAQQVVLWVCKVLVTAISAQWKPHFTFEMRHIRENIKFGTNLTGANILSFVAKNIDNILIGAFMGTEILGYYAIAFQIVSLPQMILSGSVYFTMFSKASEIHRSGQLPTTQFLKILRGVLLIGAPMLVGLAVTAPLSVPVILGSKWGPAVTLLIFLTPYGLAQTIWSPMSGVFLGLGKSDKFLKYGLISSIATIAAILIGVCFDSAAVALGVSLSTVFGAGLAMHALMKDCAISTKQLTGEMTTPFAASLLMGVIVLIVQQIIPADMSDGLRLIIAILSGLLSYPLILICIFREQTTNDLANIKAVLKRSQA